MLSVYQSSHFIYKQILMQKYIYMFLAKSV